VGNRTQASRERLNLTRIKHRAQPTLVILMAVKEFEVEKEDEHVDMRHTSAPP
jgi:hypothetical protein